MNKAGKRKIIILILTISGIGIASYLWICKRGDNIPKLHIICDNIKWDRKQPCLLTEHFEKVTSDYLDGKIKFRGGVSSRYNKHSYSLKLKEKYPLCGLKANKSFILNANYIDKTMMRHKICYDLFRAMRPENKAADCRYINLYLNGQYQGLYVLMEKLNSKRLELDKNDSMAMIFKDPPVFWGENRIQCKDSGNYFQQEFPKIEKCDKSAYMEKFMDFLFHASDSLFAEEIGQWVDIDNIIDWQLLLLYTNNGDGVMKNFFLYKQNASTPFRIAPWDYDHSFGRDGDYELNMLDNIVECERAILIKRLEEIPELNYEQRLQTRWKQLRDNEIFSVSSFKKMIRDNDRTIHKSIRENEQKWPYNSPDYNDANSYRQELKLMKTYIQKRIPQLDNRFHYVKK